VKVDSTTNSNLPTLKDALSRSQQSDATPAAATAQTASTAAPATASGSGDASVSLSGLSQHLRSLAASGSADIDTAHVESIKQAIKDGTLQIDSGKIADGVLSTARELLQNKSSSTGN
jgi:negative regulator of flagellin synthesis FlgM